ncbi:hypothetical protein, partial [Rhodococcus marinonascens]|uniref:hypothetical protein n=1 Tax=Rhodococcus marinonascens TaxID=38311 RepID=UPI001C3F8750
MSAGVLPFTHVAASASADSAIGVIAQSETKFKVSCGAFSNGGGGFGSFHDVVDDLFTNTGRCQAVEA